MSLDLPLLNSTVCLDIDDVTNPVECLSAFGSFWAMEPLHLGFDVLVLAQVGGQGDHALLAEIPREGILNPTKLSALRRPVPLSIAILHHSLWPQGMIDRCRTYASARTKTSGVTHCDLMCGLFGWVRVIVVVVVVVEPKSEEKSRRCTEATGRGLAPLRAVIGRDCLWSLHVTDREGAAGRSFPAKSPHLLTRS